MTLPFLKWFTSIRRNRHQFKSNTGKHPRKRPKMRRFRGKRRNGGQFHTPRENAQKCAQKYAVPPPSEPHPPPAATFTMRRATFGRGFPPPSVYRSPSEVREIHKKPPPPQRNTPNGILTKKSKKICKKFAQLKNVCHLCNVKKIRV